MMRVGALEEAAWATALRLGTFGYAEIATELKIGHARATRIVRQWARGGSLVAVAEGHRVRRLWRIAEGAERPTAPKGRTPEENLWTAMRKLRSFTPTDLAAHATTDEISVPAEAAMDYCRSLLAAGYMRVERKAVPGVREAIYRLTRDTGPRPPRERRVRAVVDENTSAVILIGGRS